MKNPFAPPPEPGSLGGLPLHVLVRDYPELLSFLREVGIDPIRDGGRSLEELRPDGAEAVLSGIERRIAWRACPDAD